MVSAVSRIHRDVVSYVRRSARMNPSQQKAWDAHHDEWVIELAAGERQTSVADHAHIDWTAAFGRSAPLIVEIGSGTGAAITQGALTHPEANLVAFEVFTPAVASTLSKLARNELSNVRLVVADGAQALATVFDEARSVSCGRSSPIRGTRPATTSDAWSAPSSPNWSPPDSPPTVSGGWPPIGPITLRRCEKSSMPALA